MFPAEARVIMPTKRETHVPTIRAQYLGHRMREMRDDLGLTLKYVATYLGVEFSTLARYERAEWPFRKEHVLALLDLYRVQDEQLRDNLTMLALTASRANQWYHEGVRRTGDDRPMVDRWWIHDRAETICTYSTMLLPELLQTAAYTTTTLRHTLPANLPAHTLENAAHAVQDRQRVLSGKSPTALHAVIEDAALRRKVGAPETMRSQLEHLTTLARAPHIQIQVVDTMAGVHAGAYGAFTLYRMRNPYPAVAFVEHLDGALAIEAGSVERYETAFDELAKAARDPNESIAYLDYLKETP
jgi:hypothetical protein